MYGFQRDPPAWAQALQNLADKATRPQRCGVCRLVQQRALWVLAHVLDNS